VCNVNDILTVCHTLLCLLLVSVNCSGFFFCFLRRGEEDPLRGCCVKEERKGRSIHVVAGVEAFGWADTFDREGVQQEFLILYFPFIFSPFLFFLRLQDSGWMNGWKRGG
jgi:hypothetical protein